ncbi:hypothetical protein AWZ03_010714 [Drosophila navojoa]|uniref:Uncharacterized protein n=1 Tax=Drosophila navojoa TaxID=7232 RepID=A0A484B4V5_DRONA|nr:hypothetical protein AWZ03_010714 [Drosophila navojoa]
MNLEEKYTYKLKMLGRWTLRWRPGVAHIPIAIATYGRARESRGPPSDTGHWPAAEAVAVAVAEAGAAPRTGPLFAVPNAKYVTNVKRFINDNCDQGEGEGEGEGEMWMLRRLIDASHSAGGGANESRPPT